MVNTVAQFRVLLAPGDPRLSSQQSVNWHTQQTLSSLSKSGHSLLCRLKRGSIGQHCRIKDIAPLLVASEECVKTACLLDDHLYNPHIWDSFKY